jgi:hypothetical protein
MERENLVWIELPKPENKEEAEEYCRLANNMMRRLVGDRNWNGSHFFWSEHKNMYCFGGGAGTFKYLSDRGEWFNLDYLGRELTEEVEA